MQRRIFSTYPNLLAFVTSFQGSLQKTKYEKAGFEQQQYPSTAKEIKLEKRTSNSERNISFRESPFNLANSEVKLSKNKLEFAIKERVIAC